MIKVIPQVGKRGKQMKRHMAIVGALMVIVSLTGCASTTTSRTAMFKPTDSSNAEWSIYAKAENGAFGDKIMIYINEKEVVTGTLGATARDTFSAKYEGRKVDSECFLTKDGGLQLGHMCMIYIDSKKIAELSF